MTHTPLADLPSPPTTTDPWLARARAVADDALAHAAALDVDGAFPHREIDVLHRSGLLHAPFASAWGGCDLGSPPCDPLLCFRVLAAIGEGSLPLGRLFEGHVNAVKLVRLYGSAENLALLRAEADAGRLSGVWMAEDGSPLQLDADPRSPDRFVLRGRKILASGAGHIRRPLIAAKTAAGSRMLLPKVADAGRVDLAGWTAQGMKATATGTVDFSGLTVGSDECVGMPGDYLRSPYFRGGAWRVMAVQFGGMCALLRSARQQLVESGRDTDRLQRMRFGQGVAARETARLWIAEACRRAEDDRSDPAGVDAYVDLMRGAFEAQALALVERVQKSLGLKAFLVPNAAERIVRDLTTYLRQPALDASLDSAADFFFHHAIDDASA